MDSQLIFTVNKVAISDDVFELVLVSRASTVSVWRKTYQGEITFASDAKALDLLDNGGSPNGPSLQLKAKASVDIELLRTHRFDKLL